MTRLRITFVGLIVVATAALATLTSALAAPAGPTAGLTVAASALTLLIALSLGLRLLHASDQARSRSHP